MADNIGTDIVQPGETPPPQNPEEMQQRVSGWQRFLDRLQSDPSLAAGVMRFGTQLMQPVAPGQTPIGHFGGALEHSIDYTAAMRANQQEQAQRAAQSGATVGLEQARTGAVQQETRQKTALEPTALAREATELSRAQAALRAINAEEASGVQDPTFIKRKADAELALKDATAKMYGAHAAMYGAAAAKEAVSRQTTHTSKVENADGTQTIVNSHMVNGQPYIETYTLPRFTDPNVAREAATKSVDKETPFFGQPTTYSGTKAQEIARRTQMYLTPQHNITDRNGRGVTPAQFEALDKPGEKVNLQSDAALQGVRSPGGGDTEANIRQLQAALAANPHPVARKALEDELVVQLNAQEGHLTNVTDKGASAVPGGGIGKPLPGANAQTNAPIQVVGEPGSLRRADAAMAASVVTPKGPTPKEISDNPRLAQTTPEQRAAMANERQRAEAVKRREFEMKVASATTPQAKMQLFREYSDVMTRDERRQFASGRQ